MNFQFYIEKLNNCEEFKKFKKENKDAFLCSCFFDFDFKGKDNKQHLDYYVPSKKELFSFQLENNCKKEKMELFKEEDLRKIPEDIKIDFNEIGNLVFKKLKDEKIKNKVQKAMFSLQKKNKKEMLIGTIFISNLGLVKMNIDLEKKQVTDFEKKSFFDMMNIFKRK